MGKKTVGALSVVGVVLVAGAVVILKFGVSGLLRDATSEAEVGDCLAALPAGDSVTAAEIVGCDEPEARHSVVGRVDDRTARQAGSDRACAAFPEADAIYHVLGPDGGAGYALCLKPLGK